MEPLKTDFQDQVS